MMQNSERSVRLVKAGLLGALMGLAIPASANAQLGGLIKKVQGQMTASAPAAPATPAATAAAAGSPAGPSFGTNVLEMTSPVLARFEAALAAERAELDAFTRLKASAKSPKQYEECQLGVLTRPEVLARYETAGSDMERLQALQVEISAMLEKQCGPDPDKLGDWRVAEVRREATQKGLAAGDFTGRQMDVLKERVLPFCAQTAAGAAPQQQIPGRGRNIFYVYSAAEMEALQPRCGALTVAIRAVE